MARSDEIAFYYTITLCGLMTIYSAYYFAWAMLKTAFKWVKLMLFLCVAQSASDLLFGVSLYLETIASWHDSHVEGEHYFVMLAVFLEYFLQNVTYWLFGFKYWVVSIEMSRFLKPAEEKGEKAKGCICTESKYNAVSTVVIAINLVACIAIGWGRGMLDYWMVFPQGPSEHLTNTVIVLYLTVSGLLVIAACFLADALRRLKQQFNSDKRIEQDKKVMSLHVIAIFTYTFFGLCLQAAVINYFINPGALSNDILSYTRMVMLTSQSVSQIIMIYLIMRFTKAENE